MQIRSSRSNGLNWANPELRNSGQSQKLKEPPDLNERLSNPNTSIFVYKSCHWLRGNPDEQKSAVLNIDCVKSLPVGKAKT